MAGDRASQLTTEQLMQLERMVMGTSELNFNAPIPGTNINSTLPNQMDLRSMAGDRAGWDASENGKVPRGSVGMRQSTFPSQQGGVPDQTVNRTGSSGRVTPMTGYLRPGDQYRVGDYSVGNAVLPNGKRAVNEDPWKENAVISVLANAMGPKPAPARGGGITLKDPKWEELDTIGAPARKQARGVSPTLAATAAPNPVGMSLAFNPIVGRSGVSTNGYVYQNGQRVGVADWAQGMSPGQMYSAASAPAHRPNTSSTNPSIMGAVSGGGGETPYTDSNGNPSWTSAW